MGTRGYAIGTVEARPGLALKLPCPSLLPQHQKYHTDAFSYHFIISAQQEPEVWPDTTEMIYYFNHVLNLYVLNLH